MTVNTFRHAQRGTRARGQTPGQAASSDRKRSRRAKKADYLKMTAWNSGMSVFQLRGALQIKANKAGAAARVNPPQWMRGHEPYRYRH